MALDPLVSTEWLAARLGDPSVRILDASWWFPHENRDAADEFNAAHIPGAARFDIDAIADHATALPHMLPTPEAFAEKAGALGIGDETTVVIYAADPTRSAARAWWSFRVMGHADVCILDGGLPKWRAEGRPMESGSAKPASAHFTPRFDPALVRNADQVASALESGDAQVVDARPAPRFRGEAPEPRAGLRSGHMPGARSLPSGSLYRADGLMLSPPELVDRIAAAGIDPNKPLIASCGSGVTACIVALALARIGHDRTAVYDGSWAEWGASHDRAVVTGA